VTSKESVIAYLTKYIAKPEKASAAMVEILEKILHN